MITEKLARIKYQPGFFAALDQSGGSTPKVLANYGIDDSAYSNDQEMFDLIHRMRKRIMTHASFNSDRIVAAILFEDTIERTVLGQPTASYLWEKKRIVPFIKCDQGLLPENNGVQLLKPIKGLDSLLERAKDKGIFGTKMRSVINTTDIDAIRAVVAQQFEIGHHILSRRLVPIIEPEVDIHLNNKEQVEAHLKTIVLEELAKLADEDQIILKVTIPSQANLYTEWLSHPKVIRVVALSGGYSRDVAVKQLSQNQGLIASFSRALTEGLSVQQNEQAFGKTLEQSIAQIYQASI